jgi:hypothetical protein
MARDPARRRHRAASAALAVAAVLGASHEGAASGPAPAAAASPRRAEPATAIDPARVSGVERRGIEEGDALRTFGAGVLFIPREMVRLMFLAGGVTAGLVRDEQVVPRVGELLSPSPGNISVIPSLFIDTRRRTSAGAQVIASGKESGTRLSFGFGGVHDLLGEARARFGFSKPIPIVLSVDVLADSRSTLDYLGVGQRPDKDARNRFRSDALTREATYYETRVRGIASIGARVASDWEVFLSTSLLKSRVDDTPGGGPSTISRVFEPGTVSGAPTLSPPCSTRKSGVPCFAESRIVYSELALRLDTRVSPARPSSGVLVETYGGFAHGLGGDETRFYRVGGRAALFVSILRPTNILSPRILIDGMVVPHDAPEPPFTSLVSQPDFRGLDTRRDRVSLVASVDYRWSVVRYLGARVFVDVATVGPDVGAMLNVPVRVAGGFGVDVFSKSTELAQLIVSFSGEGARAYLTFGVPSLFGDRQHRY